MDPDAYTIGFICPLSIELDAVLAIFDDRYEDETKVCADLRITFYQGKIYDQQAVAVCLPQGQMGIERAGDYAHELVTKYPSLDASKGGLRFLVGIAGGVPSSRDPVRLGDVVVATKVMNYQKGTMRSGEDLEPSNEIYDAPSVLLDGLNQCPPGRSRYGRVIRQNIQQMVANYRQRYGRDEGDEAAESWSYPQDAPDILYPPDYQHVGDNERSCDKCDETRAVQRQPRDHDLPNIFYGLIATGNSVLRDAMTRESLKSGTLAVDMESSALKHYEYIVVRGICDYADSHKNKKWQNYAAATASGFTKLLIKSLLKIETPSPPDPPESDDSEDSDPPESDDSEDSDLPTEKHPEGSSETSNENHKNKAVPEAPSVSSLKFDIVEVYGELYNERGKNEHLKFSCAAATMTLTQDDHPANWSYSRHIILVYGKNERNLWLPVSQVKVSQQGSQFVLNFANCNGLGYAIPDQTLNGQMQYQAVYNPNETNVRLEFQISDKCNADDFADWILNPRRILPGLENPVEFNGCSSTKRVWVFGKTGPNARTAIFQLVETATESSTSLYIDFAILDQYLDLLVDPKDEGTIINLLHLSGVQYIPADQIGASWPLDKVQNNPTGQPEQIETRTRSMNMKICLQKTDVTHFTDILLPSWKLTNVFNIEVDPRKSSQQTKPFADQMTVWNDKQAYRIFIRYRPEEQIVRWMCIGFLGLGCSDNSEKDEQSDVSQSRRFSLIGKKPKIPSLHVDKTDFVVDIKSVSLLEGECIRLDEFQVGAWLDLDGNGTSGDNKPKSETKSTRSKRLTDMKIKFSRGGDRDEFVSAIKKAFPDICSD